MSIDQCRMRTFRRSPSGCPRNRENEAKRRLSAAAVLKVNRIKPEDLIHRIFEPARLEIGIMDRFGRPVVPREWFLVPLFVIKEAVEKNNDGSISGYRYDPDSASLLVHA